MGDILIRDVDEQVIQNLSNRAAAQGTSMEEYAKEILTSKVGSQKRLTRQELIRKADEFRKRVGPQKTDSTDLIREDRDNR